MDKEYHYDMTYVIALRAGYNNNDAHVIAYSSQHTDDNNYPYKINIDRQDAYSNYMSQTFNIRKPRKTLLRIYPIFHFFPGTRDEICNLSTPRKDGKLHLLKTIPGNSNARSLMERAMGSENLYRIGIATHVFSDTWCHQNFVGCHDSFNALGSVTPNVGHLGAKHSPDIPGYNWKDKRLVSAYTRINNTERILEAAGEVFEIFSEEIQVLKQA